MQRPYNIIPAAVCILLLSGAAAQTDIDALRYSQTTFGGTARGIAVGGALGALGADFASFSINPAGLGVNQSSYFVFTPSVNSIKTTSDYIGTSYTDYKYNFNLSNFGLVYADPSSSGNYNWSGISFAFGHNRLSNYHRQSFFSGFNPDNSLLDRYLEDANGNTSPENFYDNFPFGAGLAWETYLLNPADTSAAWDASQNYVSVLPDGNITQSRTSITRGAMDEYTLSIGSGYRDKLYIGGTIGIPYIRYREETTYREDDSENLNIFFNNFTLTDNVSTNGTGANFKLGLIYRLTEWVRIGGAIHTPTYFAMTDRFSSSMSSSLTDSSGNISYASNSPDGSFNYSLTTPWRTVGSLAFVFREIGFLSVDYEYIDYGLAAFRFNTSDPNEKILANEINQTIRSKYGPASNIRIGTEIKKDVMRVRLGYAMYGSPFKSDVASYNSRTTYSGGIGYSDDDIFIDLTYAKTITDEYYAPYTLSASGETIHGTNQTIFQNNFLLTFGVKF